MKIENSYLEKLENRLCRTLEKSKKLEFNLAHKLKKFDEMKSGKTF